MTIKPIIKIFKPAWTRALEVIPGGELLDGNPVKKYGTVNRALPQADLYDDVTPLATHIANLPAGIARIWPKWTYL